MLIRRETAADVDAVEAVHRAAFTPPAPGTDPVEVALLRALRQDVGWVPVLSMVATGPEGAVAGHGVCTVGAVGEVAALGLGPIGVEPRHQGTGVGSALMHALLGAADALGYPVVVLLGHLDFYRRFGFGPARELGITAPDPAWGDHFQARPLSEWTPDVHGPFRYAAPFDAL